MACIMTIKGLSYFFSSIFSISFSLTRVFLFVITHLFVTKGLIAFQKLFTSLFLCYFAKLHLFCMLSHIFLFLSGVLVRRLKIFISRLKLSYFYKLFCRKWSLVSRAFISCARFSPHFRCSRRLEDVLKACL